MKKVTIYNNLNLLDMNGNPTISGYAIWQVKKTDGSVLFEGTEQECRKFSNGIHSTKDHYLNAISK